MINLGLGRAGVALAKRVTVTSLSGYQIHRIDKPGGQVVLQVLTPEGRLIVRLKLNQNQWSKLTR